jgi:hypothetical protein
VKIEVLWEDLVEGELGFPSRCAIARAINRMYPHYTNVTVGKNTIRLNDKRKGVKLTWNTPKPAIKFIEAFDSGKSVEPGLRFDLFEHNALKQPLRKSTPGASRAARAPRATVKSQVLEGVPSIVASPPTTRLTEEQRRARIAKRRSA